MSFLHFQISDTSLTVTPLGSVSNSEIPQKSRVSQGSVKEVYDKRHDKFHLSCDHGSGKVGTVTRLTGGYWFGRDHLMKMWSRADHDIIFHCGLHKVYVPVHGFFDFFPMVCDDP